MFREDKKERDFVPRPVVEPRLRVGLKGNERVLQLVHLIFD